MDDNPFFSRPILNSPYAYPSRHWELDKDGQPTQTIVARRRRADFITPVPRPKKRSKSLLLPLDEGQGLSTPEQAYAATAETINEIRSQVDAWRQIPDPARWHVTPTTARLLQHWRHHEFGQFRPFFCQLEAVETVIWLTEVAPNLGKPGRDLLERLEAASHEANPDLARVALKLATGAGKTTVMAMLIAWQTLNAVRQPNSKRFTRGFLVVTPGITIKDRLRVLQPNDPDSYYKSRELVPTEFLEDLSRAKIVITNYHAFLRRERMPISKGGRALLQGHGEAIQTLETDGQMMQRVMPDLMAFRNILVLNDEAHHCYREKPVVDDPASPEDAEEARRNNEAARVWISGLETVQRDRGLNRIVDLSATPFFLSGSGYAEGTLFPWTVCDFSLMDAIECGIVKLPRVPVADNIPEAEVPMYRNLWRHIGTRMPKKGRARAEGLDPLALPTQLQTALEALYGHYVKTYEQWQAADIRVPPCFIVVCNNTATSKLVYDYISGFQRANKDGTTQLEFGRLALFRNHDEHGNPLARPRTLLIDSEQLESGDALDDQFRAVAGEEIERFRREIVERSGNPQDGEAISDQDLLREVMNTVGKEGRLGESIRCVVSVAMLTEGWDANTVTHVLGVRAFGTQLLCEQVIGRALRRQSYEANAEGYFEVEYADVLGIPFDFTARPVVSTPAKPPEVVRVKAVRPERDGCEIAFPRVMGYRVDLPDTAIEARFNEDSRLTLTPELVGATETTNAGIIGAQTDLNLVHIGDVRPSTLSYGLAAFLLERHYRDSDGNPELPLFGKLKQLVRQWLDGYLVCAGGTYPAQLRYKTLAEMACDRIHAAITRAYHDVRPVRAVLDPYNPTGSTAFVNFTTTRTERWQADPGRCHVNWVILDSGWEGELCRVLEKHPQVRAYVKNHNLGFEAPYRFGSENRRYRPDFIVLVDDGRGDDDLLRLVIEVKGYRREDAQAKKMTMDTYWIPGVNALGAYGRWAFAEFTQVFEMEDDLNEKIAAQLDAIVAASAVKA